MFSATVTRGHGGDPDGKGTSHWGWGPFTVSFMVGTTLSPPGAHAGEGGRQGHWARHSVGVGWGSVIVGTPWARGRGPCFLRGEASEGQRPTKESGPVRPPPAAKQDLVPRAANAGQQGPPCLAAGVRQGSQGRRLEVGQISAGIRLSKFIPQGSN